MSVGKPTLKLQAVTLRVEWIHVDLQNKSCMKVYKLLLPTPKSRRKKNSERNSDQVPKI